MCWTQILLLIIFLRGIQGLTQKDQEFLAYDCTAPQEITDTGFIGTPVCIPSQQVVKTENKEYQILQFEQFQRTEGYSCKVEESRSAHYCGTYDHQTAIPQLTRTDIPLSINEEECRQLRQGVYIDPHGGRHSVLTRGFTEIKYNLAGTTYYSSGEVKCEGQDYHTGSEVLHQVVMSVQLKILIQEEIIMMNQQDVIAHISNQRLPCSILAGGCKTGVITYVWTKVNDTCPLAVTRTAKGKELTNADDTSVFISTDGSLIRIIREESVSMCGRVVFKTNYPDLYIHPMGHAPFTRAIHPGEVSLVTYINNRDDFLYNHLKTEIEKEFHHVLDNDCKQQSKLAKLHFWLQHRDSALTTWFLGNGTFATTSGELVYHYRCRPVLVKAIVETLCYQSLPVIPIRHDDAQQIGDQVLEGQQHGRTLFMEPLTHRLTYHGIVAPCSKQFVPKYRNANGDWIMVMPDLQLAVPPKLPSEVLSQTTWMSSAPNFADGGVYTREELKSMEQHQDFSRTILALGAKLAQQIPEYSSFQPIRPDQMFPNYNPSAWVTKMYDKTTKFLVFWGEIASIFISIAFIWQIFKAGITWTYNIFVLREVHGCTKQLLWAPCMGLLLMTRYKKETKVDAVIRAQMKQARDAEEGRYEALQGAPPIYPPLYEASATAPPLPPPRPKKTLKGTTRNTNPFL